MSIDHDEILIDHDLPVERHSVHHHYAPYAHSSSYVYEHPVHVAGVHEPAVYGPA